MENSREPMGCTPPTSTVARQLAYEKLKGLFEQNWLNRSGYMGYTIHHPRSYEAWLDEQLAQLGDIPQSPRRSPDAIPIPLPGDSPEARAAQDSVSGVFDRMRLDLNHLCRIHGVAERTEMTDATFSPEGLGAKRTLSALGYPRGFVTGDFSEDPKGNPAARASRVYSISDANDAKAHVVYNWKELRPFTTCAGEAVYSVAEYGLDPSDRGVVEQALEAWATYSNTEGREIVVPVNVGAGPARFLRVRSSILLLPFHSPA